MSTQNDISTSSTSTAAAQKTRTRCEVWTRVMGYYRPVSQFNIGKKSEFRERAYFGTEVPAVRAGDVQSKETGR